MPPHSVIETALERLRLAARRAIVLEGTVWSAAALMLAACWGVAFAQLGLERTALFGFLALVVAGVAGIAIWSMRRIAVETELLLRTASLAEGLAPELGTSARSAVDFSREGKGSGHSSPDLVAAHLDRTADIIAKLDLPDRYRKDRKPQRKRSGGSFLGLLVLAVILVATLDEGRSRLAAMLMNPTSTRVSEVPLVGDITVVYNYPAYTGQAPRKVEGGDGTLQAVIGTQVEISATTEEEVRRAILRFVGEDEAQTQDVVLEVEDGRVIKGTVGIIRSGTYYFELTTAGGDSLEDPIRHPVVAQLDAYPTISMDAPKNDIELKDDREVDVLWSSQDDFGIGEVALVIQQSGRDPQRIVLAGSDETEPRREGRYRWSVAELGLKAGVEVNFFLEALDNDAVAGPKKATSAVRKLEIYSAQQKHMELIDAQREILGELVDHLAGELNQVFRPNAEDVGARINQQRNLVGDMQELSSKIGDLVTALSADRLVGSEAVDAFVNVREHLTKATRQRAQVLQRLDKNPDDAGARRALSRAQDTFIELLESDIIYLDDLIALQKIDELKDTAQDLLSAQRELQQKLERFRETQDPGLKAELQREIKSLRNRMMQMISRMANIKAQLPGEYRNMEAGRMLEMDNQLDRLEEMLQQGKLDEAAAELEQLASMLENMVGSIEQSESEFGGERYSEMRQQLQDFGNEFSELESEQKAIADQVTKMEQEFRKRAMQRAGGDLAEVIAKARRLTGNALTEIDDVASRAPANNTPLANAMAKARQRLRDLDTLLEQKDISEAREFATLSVEAMWQVQGMLSSRGNSRTNRQLSGAAKKGLEQAREAKELLDSLFPDPREVMSEAEMQRMGRMAQKQDTLDKMAERLGKRMQELSGEMPLFGQQPKQSLEGARQQMRGASESLRNGQIPRAAGHEKRALEELGKLRESLEQASGKGQGGGGLPLPLGNGGGPGGGSGGQRSRDPVELPKASTKGSKPEFIQKALDGAKGRAPEDYEEQTREYFRGLIKQ